MMRAGHDVTDGRTTVDRRRPIIAGRPETVRRRKMAIEHLLFGMVRFLAQRYPELPDELGWSLDHLWDKAHGEERDDEAVRHVAQRFVRSLRAEG